MSTDPDTLVSLFRSVAADPAKRNAVVLKDRDKEWTLAELDDITERLAKLFVSQYDTKKGSTVAIFMNKRAEYVFAYIAALKAGAAYLPLDISYPQNLLSSVLDEIKPTVVATTSEYAERLPAETAAFNFTASESWKKGLSDVDQSTRLPDDLTPDDLAFCVYSSGTTGKPKGIACPHRGAVLSYKYRFRHFPFRADDIVACNVFFVWELLRPILQGVKMTIIPDDVIYDPVLLCQFVKDEGVTRMLFTPSLLETILDTQSVSVVQGSFKSFRLIWLCGEVVTCSLLERAITALGNGVVIANLYSISETHDVAVEVLSQWYRRGEQRKFAPVGKLIPGVRVLILDGNLRRVPIGCSGEIYVAGPTLAHGYINRPELNRDRFLPVPEDYRTETGGDRMYRTGDWGYLLANGTIEICGRCDTLVKIRGYSVEIQAIESTLHKLPYIASCAVISIGEEGDDKQLAAFLVLKRSVPRKTIRADLKKLLPFYMVPQYFVFLERLPVLAASSKIDRKALPGVDLQKDVVEVESLPQTPTERRLASVWSEILQLGTLDIQESFFDLGGHSLLAARLLARISAEFGVELTMRDLFASPTVCEMAKILDGAIRVSPERSVDLDHQVKTHVLGDSIMDLHLRAFWRSTEWGNPFCHANILLTGATGYLGSHLLARLLQDTQVRVVCLVRESSTETVNMRLNIALKKYGLFDEERKKQLEDRVRVVSGDVALVQFGLSEEQYLFLSYDIDVVIHAAAYVNLIYPYQALHGINVLGTRNVLNFCHANKVKPLHYISTDAVVPAGLANVDEDFEVQNTREKLTDGYGQSKYVAEQIVRDSGDRGLPTIIYRLGNQAASLSTGFWNNQDFTYLLLQSIIHTGTAPDVDWIVEMTPVDFSAQFIIELATKAFCQNVGKIYHLVNTVTSPKLSDVVQWLRILGYRIENIDVAPWLQSILTSKDAALQQFQKLVQVMIQDEAFFLTQTTFLRTNTDKFLSYVGWKYATVDERVFEQWTKKLVARGVIPPPSQLSSHVSLARRVAIVTGASEGIGAAIAQALAVEGGARVVLAARQVDKLRAVATACQNAGCPPEHLLVTKCDVTRLEDVEAMVRATLQRWEQIDVLVNCAGVMYYTLMKNKQRDEWARQIDVNCHGTTNVTGAVLPHMITRNAGHILNVTSDAGKRGFAGLAVYSGSKFFIEGFSQAVRQEVLDCNIRITNVQPGDVATELAGRSSDAEAREKYDCSGAGHRILDPADVARTVLFALAQPPHVALNEILIEPQKAPI